MPPRVVSEGAARQNLSRVRSRALAAVAGEAHSCLSVQSFRGAVALARAVVEATAKEKGITTRGIQAKIDELIARGLIYEHVKDAAHEVAHGDLVDEPIGSDEAAVILELMDMVLDGVFGPGKTAAQAARRQACGT